MSWCDMEQRHMPPAMLSFSLALVVFTTAMALLWGGKKFWASSWCQLGTGGVAQGLWVISADLGWSQGVFAQCCATVSCWTCAACFVHLALLWLLQKVGREFMSIPLQWHPSWVLTIQTGWWWSTYRDGLWWIDTMFGNVGERVVLGHDHRMNGGPLTL